MDNNNNSVNSIVPATEPTLHNGDSALKRHNIFENEDEEEWNVIELPIKPKKV